MQQSINHTQKHSISQNRFMFSESNILGKGATGIVYKGYDQHENKQVAIKVIQTSKMNQVQKSLIQNEKKALRMLKHPNIMKLIHIEQQSSYTFIVSELYEGGSLQQFLSQRGSFNEQEALEFFRKIISGYCAIVEANIIHRDLKPMNILLSKSNEPVIIDFGYSQIIVANKNLTVFNVGSPSYMSPQAFTKTIFSQKSDVWSLGAIFYQLLTNKTLDENIQSKLYFQMLKNSQFPPINFDSFSQVSKQILKSALAVKSQQRATAHKIKYLLDKEILGKRFQGKVLKKTVSFQVNELRQTISNSNSIANFNFLNNQIDFSKLKHDDDMKIMLKKPTMNKTYSSIPFRPLNSQRTFVHSAQSIQEGLKKQQDFIVEKDNQTDSISNSNSGHGSLKISPSESRIQYIPVNQYQKSYGHIYQNESSNTQNNKNKQNTHSIQNSFGSQMIKINNFHPRIQRQASFNSNSSDYESLNHLNLDRKSITHNEGFFNRNKTDRIEPLGNNMQKNKNKQQLYYSNQINPPQRIDNIRPNIQLAKTFSSSSESYLKTIQKVNHNENFTARVSHKNTNPISMKLLTRQLEEKAAVQSQNNFNGIQNHGLRQKNQYFDQIQKVNQSQKLYLSQQNSLYQKTNFEQTLRATMSPQTQFNFQRVINQQANNNNNNNQMFNHTQPFGQSIRNTIDHSARPLIGLRKIV